MQRARLAWILIRQTDLLVNQLDTNHLKLQTALIVIISFYTFLFVCIASNNYMNSIKRKFGKKHVDETSYRMNNDLLQIEVSEEKVVKNQPLKQSLIITKTDNGSNNLSSCVKEISHNIDISNYNLSLTKSK